MAIALNSATTHCHAYITDSTRTLDRTLLGSKDLKR